MMTLLRRTHAEAVMKHLKRLVVVGHWIGDTSAAGNSPFCLIRSSKMSLSQRRQFLLMRRRLFRNRIRFILAYYCQNPRVCHRVAYVACVACVTLRA